MKKLDPKKCIPILMACLLAAASSGTAMAYTADVVPAAAEQEEQQEQSVQEGSEVPETVGNPADAAEETADSLEDAEKETEIAQESEEAVSLEEPSSDERSLEEAPSEEASGDKGESVQEESTEEAGAVPAAAQSVTLSQNGSDGVVQLQTYSDLMNTPGLSGTVQTQGHDAADDGAGMTYTIMDTRPSGVLGNVAIPTVDGKWAVPSELSRTPAGEYDEESVEDAMKRAQTFADAGSQLVWDPSRFPPLYDLIVHEEYDAPYPLTCSSFVGQVLAGWDYEHTTYVEDQNTVVGDYVDFGAPTHTFHWQAWKLAKWFATEDTQGDIWLNDAENPQYQRGDILFFSQQDPEGAGTTGKYFGNIFHTGIYLGDGKVIQAYSAETPGGVMVEDLSDWLKARLSFVARPKYTDYQKPELSEITEGDTVLKGTAQPNIAVTVTLPDGTTLTTKSDENGNFSVDVPEAVVLSEQDTVTVYSTNAAQNNSETGTAVVAAKQVEPEDPNGDDNTGTETDPGNTPGDDNTGTETDPGNPSGDDNTGTETDPGNPSGDDNTGTETDPGNTPGDDNTGTETDPGNTPGDDNTGTETDPGNTPGDDNTGTETDPEETPGNNAVPETDPEGAEQENGSGSEKKAEKATAAKPSSVAEEPAAANPKTGEHTSLISYLVSAAIALVSSVALVLVGRNRWRRK